MRGVLLLTAAAAFAMLMGCAGAPAPSTNQNIQKAAAQADAGRYAEAAQTYRKEAAAPLGDSTGEALYQLACLLAFYDNPQKDYALALRGFDEYVRRYPKGPRIRDAKNWRYLLTTVLDLREKIDQLKQIDITHEEKRTQ
ncbi:MAG: tetratricopeptide repeat protein [Spirochaetia bacterium]